jgi:hypothetical protein
MYKNRVNDGKNVPVSTWEFPLFQREASFGSLFVTVYGCRVYLFPPPAVWTCRVYLFPLLAIWTIGHAEYIPVHMFKTEQTSKAEV